MWPLYKISYIIQTEPSNRPDDIKLVISAR